MGDDAEVPRRTDRHLASGTENDAPAGATVRRYPEISTLAQAREQSNGIVVLEGDHGGHIFVVARASAVHCDEYHLRELLRVLDDALWPTNFPGPRISFAVKVVGSRISGGLGGGIVTNGLWCHPRVEAEGLYSLVNDVLGGRRQALGDVIKEWTVATVRLLSDGPAKEQGVTAGVWRLLAAYSDPELWGGGLHFASSGEVDSLWTSTSAPVDGSPLERAAELAGSSRRWCRCLLTRSHQTSRIVHVRGITEPDG